MNNILELQSVCKRFEQFALKDVTFSLPKGYIMGFIGPNGAGKTTTIKLILNMLQNDSGRIRLFGEDARTSEALRERIGIVLDQPFYVDEWNLTDIERSVAPFYRRWDSHKYVSLLSNFDLDPKKKVKDLSRGMKMKLMMAAALSHDADLLILDEPTSGLDAVARNELMEILGDFLTDEEKGILFSTHITADLEKIADYITFILNGQIKCSLTKDEFLEKYCIVKGKTGALSPEQKKCVIGYREHSFGWEGLVETAALGGLPGETIAETGTLDEIIIHFTKEGTQNA